MRLDRIESRLEMLEEKLRTEHCELSSRIADTKTDFRQQIKEMHTEIKDIRIEISSEKTHRIAAKLDLFMILWVFFAL
jgi:hypothetical protein